MSWIWWVLGGFAVIWAGLRIAAWRQLRRIRLRPGGSTPCNPDGIPAPLLPLLRSAGQALESYGFAFRGAARSPSSDAHDPEPVFALIWEHPDEVTWAVVSPHPLPEPELPVALAFVTRRPDGTWLVGCDGWAHLMLGGLPQATIIDHLACDPVTAWISHRRWLEAHQQRERIGDLPAFCAAWAALNHDYPAWLGQRRLAVAVEPNVWRLSALGAWRLIGQVHTGTARVAQAIARRRAVAPAPPLPPEVEALAIRRLDAARDSRGGAGASAWLFLITLGLSALVFASDLDQPLHLAIFLALLLFHELGHLLAMRACGYRDTAIFFLPFLGAATTGRKQDATIPQQVLVSLMGPAPGIVLGSLLLALHLTLWPSELLRFAGGIALVLNLLNLVPLLPLDGGHVVQRLYLARSPRLDLAFRAIAAAILIGLGAAIEPLRVLVVIGVFIGLALPQQAAKAALHRALLAQGLTPADPPQRRLEAVCAALGRHPFGRQGFVIRAQAARELRDALGTPRVSAGAIAGLTCAYVGCWLIAPLILVPVLVLRG